MNIQPYAVHRDGHVESESELSPAARRIRERMVRCSYMIDDNWQGQAEGGSGLWWIPDDIGKIAMLLNNNNGTINGKQILDPALLSAALQQDPSERGVRIDSRRMYNNAFWANRYSQADGFGCELWVVEMLGISGNVVALMPNGITYYYFSDNQEFTWDSALWEANKMIPLCP